MVPCTHALTTVGVVRSIARALRLAKKTQDDVMDKVYFPQVFVNLETKVAQGAHDARVRGRVVQHLVGWNWFVSDHEWLKTMRIKNSVEWHEAWWNAMWSFSEPPRARLFRRQPPGPPSHMWLNTPRHTSPIVAPQGVAEQQVRGAARPKGHTVTQLYRNIRSLGPAAPSAPASLR